MFESGRHAEVSAAGLAARWSYEEFDIKIEGAARRLSVRVLRSPCGTPAARFAVPEFTRSSDAAWFGEALEAAICGAPVPDRSAVGTLHPPRRIRRFEQEARSAPRPPEVGGELFGALFPRRVRETLLQSLAWVNARETGGLRIRLHFDPSDPEQAALCRLPWELLYRSETREFLALNRRSTLVRCLDVPQLPRPPRRSGRLRVAVLAPRPYGVEAPDGELERAVLRDALTRHSTVETHVIEPPTITRLREVLRGGDFDALHFVGHGGFDDGSGEGCLLLESPEGAPHSVTGRVFAETLRAGVGLGFVFLNACDGARLPRRGGQDPYAGVATALVMSGIPAALAMQFPISEEAALAFSGVFYAALAAGDPLDAAATEGRIAVLQALPEACEWATPALYMSTLATAPWLLMPTVVVPRGAAPGDAERGRGSAMNGRETAPAVSIIGNQGVAFGNVNDSRIVINERPSPKDEADRQAKAGRQALDAQLYEQAERGFQAALATGEASALDHYHIALARACHRGLHALTGDDVRLIETQIRAIAEPQGEHLLLLALVKDAYYARHGMSMSPPPPRDLLAQVRKLRPRRDALQALARHVDWSDFAERYGLRPEELAR